MKQIAAFLADLILAVEDESNLTDYREVAKTGNRIERGFRVYLGTIPDYASADLSGVKLSGVTKDSPAELAGLKQGDVIIQLAGKKINNIYDYTFVLSALSVGKPAQLVALRGKTFITLTIVARSRE
jgi:S1-C subfamily serine protease